MSKCWRIEIWLATKIYRKSTSKKFQNRKRKCLAMILLDVFDHVRDGQWERNQKMGYINSQRIDKCSQIHIHVRKDVKREQVSVAWLKRKRRQNLVIRCSGSCQKLNEYPLPDKRRSKEHNFGMIPLISSSKVWFMDNGGLKIVLNIV